MKGLIEQLKQLNIPYSGKAVDTRLAQQEIANGLTPTIPAPPTATPPTQEGLLHQLIRMLGESNKAQRPQN